MPGQQRAYSFVVTCYRLHNGNREDMRSANPVANSRAEAIDAAKALLAPETAESTYYFFVSSVTELSPTDAKAWNLWHTSASKPEADAPNVIGDEEKMIRRPAHAD